MPTLAGVRLLGASHLGGIVPPQIPDLTLWLDAADTSTISQSGGAVDTWFDKSSLDRDYTQSTGANKPTTGSATQNGRNVLVFDGGDYLSRGSAYMWNLVQTTGFTLFAVVKRTSGDNFTVMGEGRTASDTPFARCHVDSTTNNQMWTQRNDGNTLVARTSDLNVNNTSWHVMVWSFTTSPGIPGSLIMRIDGVAGTISAADSWLTGTLTLNTNTIGAMQRTTVVTPLTGQIAEIVGYSRAVTGTETSNVEHYLRQKWGF